MDTAAQHRHICRFSNNLFKFPNDIYENLVIYHKFDNIFYLSTNRILKSLIIDNIKSSMIYCTSL